MNSYELSRAWFDFSFNNPHKIKPHHVAIYFFAIEHCNRLGWKQVFGFPTSMVLEAIGMKSYGSYKKYLDELVDFGFIKIHEYSKNQYSSNIIELTLNNKALDKALDKAFINHTTKQRESTGQSIDSIIKQYNKEQLNQLTINKDKVCIFLNSLIFKKDIVNDILLEKETKEIFNTWVDYRLDIKKPIKSDRTKIALAKKIQTSGFELSRKVINSSIENGYQGLFWDNFGNNKQPSQQPIKLTAAEALRKELGM